MASQYIIALFGVMLNFVIFEYAALHLSALVYWETEAIEHQKPMIYTNRLPSGMFAFFLPSIFDREITYLNSTHSIIAQHISL